MGLSNGFIIETLKKQVDNPTTRKTYISKLETLSNKLQKPIYDILKDPATNYPLIESMFDADATKKNYVTMVLAVFKNVNELHNKKANAHEQWKKIHENLRDKEEHRYKQNKPNAKQLDNYLSFKQIEKKYEELSNSNPHETRISSQEFLLLGLTLGIRPKRADFGNISLVTLSTRVSPTKNYIVLNGPKKSYLVLSEYKTAKKYETIKERLPSSLYRDIEASLGTHPRGFLFTDKGGDPYTQTKSYSSFVIRTFEKLFNKKVGVTMLRHIYIREKLDFNKMSQAELEKEARLMTHSPDLQRLYRWIITEDELERR